ncbi:hypothetical protein [Dactylococcopsis salina]|uniref:Uncharacterized protein n=1 Tax=Dactylococcopsis salina (strain PCC 8305) TaxID=13035 RepID=K9YXX7_DACS8|nr:hypothetical protein [Dactylococcopsis salina]AFZ51357.1 hypothetical protein Dacsa_2787 [Dactylococcopsis salina PCC 8305]
MSTKATVAHGSNFHLYKEVCDENFIYLSLEGVSFEASYNRVMVPIPVHIWEVIRQYPGTDLSWSDHTDEEIESYVEQEVNKRIMAYQQAENDQHRGLIALSGSLVYGSADSPRQEQLEQGVAYFKRLREHQQQIKQAIELLEKTNKKQNLRRS